MESVKLKEILCELCAWKFDDESLYEIHMSLVHEKTRDFNPNS